MPAHAHSYLRALRDDRGVTPEQVVGALHELYGREFTTRRYVHYEGQDEQRIRAKRLGTLTHDQVAVAIRWAAGERGTARPAQPAVIAPPSLSAAVEAIVLDAEQRDDFLRAWNDHDLTLADVQEMFDLRVSEWREALRFLGLNEATRATTRQALPEPTRAAQPAQEPAVATPPADQGRYVNPPGSNMTFIKASARRRAMVQDRIDRARLTRDQFLVMYDTRTIEEISEHYDLTHGDVYVALGLLDIPLRAGVKPAVQNPPPWPDEVRRYPSPPPVVREAEQGAGVPVQITTRQPVQEPAPDPLAATMDDLRARRDAIRTRVGEARREQQQITERGRALAEEIKVGEAEVEQVVAALAALGMIMERRRAQEEVLDAGE